MGEEHLIFFLFAACDWDHYFNSVSFRLDLKSNVRCLSARSLNKVEMQVLKGRVFKLGSSVSSWTEGSRVWNSSSGFCALTVHNCSDMEMRFWRIFGINEMFDRSSKMTECPSLVLQLQGNWLSLLTRLSAARKLKKIGQQKSPEEDHPAQEHFESVQSVSPKAGPSFNSQVVFINILESIEPEVVNAGHDYCQPDSAATLLTSLNELGERQLVKVVKWAKGLPGRRPYFHM